MKKPKPQTLEIKFDAPEPFALVVEQAKDGDRIASDKARVIDLKQQSEKRQTSFA